MFNCLKRYKKELFFGPFVKLIEAIIEVALPFIVANIINNIESYSQSEIIKYAVIMLVMVLGGYACAVCAQYIAAKTSQGFGTDFRNKVYTHIMGLKNGQINKFGSTALVNRITNDISNLEVAVAMFIRLVVRVPFICVGALIMVTILSKKIAVILVIAVIILILAIFIIAKIASKYQNKSNDALDKISKKVRESLINIKVIRSFVAEDIEYEKFKSLANEKYLYEKRAIWYSNLLNPISIVILDLSIAIMLYYANCNFAFLGIKKGDLIAIINYVSQMIFAIIVLSNLVAIYTKAFVSLKRINEIFKINESDDYDVTQFKDNKNISMDDEIIRFDNVYFGYDSQKAFIKDFNIKIKKGEIIGITGLTGSGKSTILNLLNKNYEPTQGNIFINGKSISAMSDQDVKEQVLLIEQKASIYSKSISENVKMGRSASDEDVINALKISGAWEFVKMLDEGINTNVESFGANFSGGQRQRIALARAFLGNSKIIMLDDPTSALDKETEQEVMSNIIRYVRNRDITLIIVGQKPSILELCDRVVRVNS